MNNGIKNQMFGRLEKENMESFKETEKRIVLGKFVENEIIEFNKEVNNDRKNDKITIIDEEGKKHIIK